MKWTSWATLIGLASIMSIVVWSSFRVGGIRCEVCVQFNGREACRAVDGDDEKDTHMAAVNNACAQLAGGVTDTVACQRAPLTKNECHPR